MPKLAQKINMSSMQVLKTFSLIIQDNYDMSTILDNLNANETDTIFNNSIISKYISTCKYCGIEVPKIHNKYFVTRIPFGFKLSITEVDILENMQKYITDNMSSKYIEIFDKFIKKLNQFSDKKIAKIEPKDFQKNIEQYEQAVKDRRKIRLLFKNREIIECIPIKIVEENGKTFFKIYDKKYRMIDIKRLSGIETLREHFVPINNENTEVLYKLKPPMSQRYELRTNETEISTESDGSRIILNKNENKEHLISRLLRYDIYCEVLKPIDFRQEVKQTILSTLKNYED